MGVKNPSDVTKRRTTAIERAAIVRVSEVEGLSSALERLRGAEMGSGTSWSADRPPIVSPTRPAESSLPGRSAHRPTSKHREHGRGRDSMIGW